MFVQLRGVLGERVSVEADRVFLKDLGFFGVEFSLSLILSAKAAAFLSCHIPPPPRH